MKLIASLLTLMLLSVTNTTLAEKIYRWTDENGQTHFGNQPPKSKVKQAEEVKIKTPAGSATNNSSATNDGSVTTNADANNAQANAKAKNEKNQKALAEQVLPKTISDEDAAANCNIARQGKEALGLSHNTRFQQKDGSFRPLSTEERTTKEKEVAELINQFCS